MASATGGDLGGSSPTIGVCLSAGGFRAALYATGTLRYLAEAGLLPRVMSISAISGGAILGAWLAQRWPDAAGPGRQPESYCSAAGDPFCARLAGLNLRNRWLAAWAGRRLSGAHGGRGAAFAAVLRRHMLSGQPLAGLPAGAQLVLTSTDLVTGEPFRFAREFVGSVGHGYAVPPPGLRLATATAASAVTPEYFAPVQLRRASLGLPDGPPVLSLVDGAVYDNLGTEWFEDWDARERPAQARRPDLLVVVDGAGALKQGHRPYGSLRSLLRAPRISTAHMRSERISQMRERFARRELAGVVVSIRETVLDDAPSPLCDPQVSWGLARLRTDLDRFLPLEADLLTFAGYWALHSELRAHWPDLAVPEPGWRTPASLRDESAVRSALRHGQHHLAAGRIW